MDTSMCVCGKRKGNLNTTNWTRHIKSCKKIKMTEKTEKIKITKYFSKPSCSKDIGVSIVDIENQAEDLGQMNVPDTTHIIPSFFPPEENIVNCELASSADIGVSTVYIENQAEDLGQMNVTDTTHIIPSFFPPEENIVNCELASSADIGVPTVDIENQAEDLGKMNVTDTTHIIPSFFPPEENIANCELASSADIGVPTVDIENQAEDLGKMNVTDTTHIIPSFFPPEENIANCELASSADIGVSTVDIENQAEYLGQMNVTDTTHIIPSFFPPEENIVNCELASSADIGVSTVDVENQDEDLGQTNVTDTIPSFFSPEKNIVNCELASSAGVIGQVDSMVDNDPVRFSNTITKLSFEQKKYILCLGPCQPTTQQMPLRQFPRTNKYSFRAQWYTKTLPDGSMGFRRVFDFVCSSKNRVFLFEQNQKIRNPNLPVRRLKRVTTTRWSSHSTALNTVLLTWASLVDTLEDLWKSEASSDASSFLSYFQSERFLYTCFLFKKIFSVLDPLSKTFQAIDIDLITASSMITSKRGQLLNIRNEFNSIVIEVKQFIQNHLDENFTPLPQKRSRKRKIMSGEKATDEPTSDPLTNFKYHTFYTVLDIICSQIDQKFNNDTISIFKDLSLLTKKRILEIKMDTNKIPCDAFEGIASIYSTFLNAEALNTEYLWLIDCFSNLEKTINLTKYLHKDEDNESTNSSDFESHISESDEELISQCPIEECTNSSSLIYMFKLFCSSNIRFTLPNIYMLLKIAVTLPVSSASTERSFSKLKIIKTRLRSTMAESRLEGLMRIACEQDVPINTDNVINNFAKNSNKLLKILT
ncbi:unnamed protein product [Macrosiphum euphorbiae]|uniref:HAT C-terminal dimerisation domain-containing protein n=1 Tax=Macrosiphum euphorbiae TaxID=13131 RepID=A0AAV0WNM0_9HEMI|nr:unnamed protein product [Macrosiphum euphorbiae]